MKGVQQAVLSTTESNIIHNVLHDIGEELDDHRQTINENTVELQSSYEEIQNLHSKIDKLSERIDELVLLVKGKSNAIEFSIKPLTKREKDVFFALYTLSEIKTFVTYKEIARKTALNESLVSSYILNIREKGIPIEKRMQGNLVLLRLDPVFRQEQAKKNLVGLNTLLTYWNH